MPQPRTLLLVDDDVLIHHLLRHITRAQPIDWIWARTLAEARQALAQRRPQAVLLDMSLPDGTGSDLLRQSPRLPPTLLLTGAPHEQLTLPAHPCLRGVLYKQDLRNAPFLETLEQLLDTTPDVSLTSRLASACNHC